MSDITPPEPMLPELARRNRWIVGAALASAMLHAGVLAIVLWQPLPPSAEAAQPPAIDVVLVPPPEADSASEPPRSEDASAEPSTPPPAKASSAEPPAPEQATVPAPSTAEASAPEMPAETAAPETASDASAEAAPAAPDVAASAVPEPSQGRVDPTKVAPIPLTRPVRGLTAPTSASAEAVSAPTADPDEMADGAATAGSPAVPDVATLELGTPRSAGLFYLEAMLSTPSMARARDMLETLPAEKRLAQTCNIEALAQIGNAGEGFAPDVVMAEAYALAEIIGTRLVASGAIFRSLDKWYGFAFDCTLSADLTRVTAFSYQLGTDVTDAVLARLTPN